MYTSYSIEIFICLNNVVGRPSREGKLIVQIRCGCGRVLAWSKDGRLEFELGSLLLCWLVEWVTQQAPIIFIGQEKKPGGRCK